MYNVILMHVHDTKDKEPANKNIIITLLVVKHSCINSFIKIDSRELSRNHI